MFPDVPEQFSPNTSNASQHLDDGELVVPSLEDSKTRLVLDLGALVGTVPYLARYTPHRGVVVLMVRDSQVALTTVTHSVPSPVQAPAFWRDLTPSMATADAQEAVIVVYTDPAEPDPHQNPHQDPHRNPYRDDESNALALAATCPLPVLGVARVHGDRWWDLNPTADVPHNGLPIVVDERVTSAFIGLAGRAPASSREALGAFLSPGPSAVRSRIRHALQHRRGKLPDDRHIHSAPVWDLTRATQATAGWAHVQTAHQQRQDGPVPVGEAEAVRLLDALSFLTVRDACMDWFDDAAWWLWTGLMALAPDSHVGNLGSLIALAAYCRGDGGTANVTLEHVHRVDPGHPLARLLGELFAMAAPPADVTKMTAKASRQARNQLDGLAAASAAAARTRPAMLSDDDDADSAAAHADVDVDVDEDDASHDADGPHSG